MPKDKVKGQQPTPPKGAAQKLAGAMLLGGFLGGLPAQVRLNELGATAPQRPVPFVPPKKKGRR